MAVARRTTTENVGISAKLRNVFGWIEDAAEKKKGEAIAKKRAEFRKKGRSLRSQELEALAIELEKIQRQINPLEIRAKEIKDELKVHWGYTEINEIESRLGKTLLTVSFALRFNSDGILRAIGLQRWLRYSKRVLDAKRLADACATDPTLLDQIASYIEVGTTTLSITPPSSRTPQSADAEE